MDGQNRLPEDARRETEPPQQGPSGGLSLLLVAVLILGMLLGWVLRDQLDQEARPAGAAQGARMAASLTL